MRQCARLLFPFLILPVLASSATLQARLNALLANPRLSGATWGLQVADLSTGRVVYQRNPARFLTPASNTKLFSTALALTRLGPDYRFQTVVRAASAIDPSGVLPCDLELIGGGDPSLSGRVLPYEPGAANGDPLAAIESLADEIAERGVRRIAGNIVGDDTAYFWEPYPDGWTIDDAIWDYGTPVSALVVNDNSITLKLTPGHQPGDPAGVELSPPGEHFVIQNRVETVASGPRDIKIDLLPNSRELHLWGTLPLADRVFTQSLSAGDPALFAAEVFYEALVRRGITILGRTVARHRRLYEPPPVLGGVELARRTSPPLRELLKVINKDSQNQHAEILLREVALVKVGTGSTKTGLEEMDAFLKEAGVTADEYRFSDGSGLSRQNRLTPSALVKLLVYMDRTPHRDVWIDSLPVGGFDGTLRLRFQQNAAARSAARRLQAKTGSLGHARSLSGYATSKTRGRLAFAIMVNNFRDASEIRDVVDRIGVLLTQ
jgi:D-alanyl-D-alanine carboxypeptidase/D-alanyl-D-alanine-endopeptidase (penicillin-binding protein 4)